MKHLKSQCLSFLCNCLLIHKEETIREKYFFLFLPQRKIICFQQQRKDYLDRYAKDWILFIKKTQKVVTSGKKLLKFGNGK